MTSWVGVLPYTFRDYYEACRATMSEEFQKHVMFIDNTDPDRNLGCMASHNLAMCKLFEEKADWLVIMSPAIRFLAGGDDFIQILTDHPDHYTIHAASPNVKGGIQHKRESKDEVNRVKGWHASAFSRDLLEHIGGWDTNLTLYSLCDIDMSIRIQKYKKGAPGWNTYPCEIDDTGLMAHSINLGGVKTAYEPKHEYFKAKWSREGGQYEKPANDHPFNDETKPLSWWPTPPDPRAVDHEYWDRIIKANPWEANPTYPKEGS